MLSFCTDVFLQSENSLPENLKDAGGKQHTLASLFRPAGYVHFFDCSLLKF